MKAELCALRTRTSVVKRGAGERMKEKGGQTCSKGDPCSLCVFSAFLRGPREKRGSSNEGRERREFDDGSQCAGRR